MNITIKRRIYLSFTLLVLLFVVNGLITIATLYSNRKLSNHISSVIDPSLQSMNDFQKVVIESKMYSTNWVFLRYNQDDKDALIKLHNTDYKALKRSLNSFASQWTNEFWRDSLKKVYSDFERLLLIEEKITTTLSKFEDYDDPVLKLEAERVIEDEIIPRTALVMHSLEKIIKYQQSIRERESTKLEVSSANLRVLIALLTITFICLGIFLSVYFSKIIISPIEDIKHIVNDLGKGITRFIHHHTNKDEIGEMVLSVNNLSQRLQRTASFASEVGTRNFDISFEPLSDEDTLGKALVSMRDNLKHSDAQLNEAQHLAHLGSWERDPVTNKINWSDEMFSIFGIDRASFSFHQQSFLDAVHPDDLERVKHLSRENPENHHPISFECRIITPDGVFKTIYVEDNACLDKFGKISKTSGIVQDITERKKSSLALEDALAQLKRLLEDIDQSIFSVDAVAQKVTQISVACEKIYGYPPEAFYTDFNLWLGLVYEEDLPVIDQGYASLFAGLPAVCEYRIKHMDKSLRWIEVKMIPTVNKAGKLIKIDGVINDIRKRKAAELERDRITADLIHRNKDLEQFTYIVSHNLRAPVANIMGVSNLLKSRSAEASAKDKELLSILSVSANNLNNVMYDLNEILTARTPGNETKEMISLLSIVTDIKASIQPIIDKEGVEITCDFSEVKAVFSLRTYIYSILYNLILNSIKYKQLHTAPSIQIKSCKGNGKTIICFKDNGKGIDVKKHANEIFMLYKRFDTTVEGKGIGLYMVKTAVETLGGRIELKSELNEGCEFKLELPDKLIEQPVAPDSVSKEYLCETY